MSHWTQRFAGGPQAVRHARRCVREHLTDQLPERQLDDVELLVSELATNSIRHGGCGEGVELSMEGDVSDECVRLLLCDHGEGFEAADPEPRADGRGGYGLVLLDKLSDRWGTQRNGGFCVWFEMKRSSVA
jgi:anti-sigma regulatory factor (Ser/Thr protein kinase)